MTHPDPHVALICTNDDCGLRYPSPVDDPRVGTCPLCESATTTGPTFDAPVPHRNREPASGELVGMVDNVRSALNVGTILRSADGAQLDHVWLGGYSPSADHPKVAKSSLGAESTVAASSAPNMVAQAQRLVDEGWQLWAIESTATSQSFDDISAVPARLAFVVGNERAGVDPDLLALAHRHVHFGMQGAKTSLNVGVAFGIAAYWLRALPVA